MMKRAFTLIEILVSVAIFSIVMVIALGSLLSVSAGERKAESIKTVVNNLDFALESMSRTIRTGVFYNCDSSSVPSSGELTPKDCTSQTVGASFLAFKSNDSLQPYTIYCQTGTSIWRTKAATLATLDKSCGSSNYVQMTAPEVKVSNLSFFVYGSLAYPTTGSTACNAPPAGSDCLQPKVVMALSGYVAGDNASTTSTFNIQTTITQRIYDQ